MYVPEVCKLEKMKSPVTARSKWVFTVFQFDQNIKFPHVSFLTNLLQLLFLCLFAAVLVLVAVCDLAS